MAVTIESGWMAFLFVIQKQHGALPEGVLRWLKASYFAGARNSFTISKVLAEMPEDERQQALNALVKELGEATK